MARTCSWLAAIVGSAPFALAQQTWIVDVENRPGAHFANLQAAYDAAAPGDTLVLRASRTAYGTLWANGKGVVLLGTSRAPYLRSLIVDNLPANDRMVVANLEGGSLVCRNCDGALFFDRTTWSLYGSGGYVDRCRLLVASHSRLPPDLVISASTAFFSATVSLPRQYLWGSGPRGSSMFVRESEVHLVEAYGEGSTHHDPIVWWCTFTTAALRIYSSTVSASRSTFVGGPGVLYPPGGICTTQESCAVIGTPAPTLDPSVVILNSFPACAPLPRCHVPTLSWDRTPNGIAVKLLAEPNALAILCESLPVTSPSPLAIGDLWLDPVSLLVVSMGSVGPTGERGELVPVEPGLRPGSVTALQSLVLGGSGFTLSKPAFAIEP